MSEQKDKTPEQVSDEDYKVAPTSADEKHLNKKIREHRSLAKTIGFQNKRCNKS